MIPQEVFFSHIFPRIESEEDALRALVSFAPFSTKEDAYFHWLRSPHCTLLWKALEEMDLDRYESIVLEYPNILRVRDGEILSALLFKAVEVVHKSNKDVLKLLALFQMSIENIMGICSDKAEKEKAIVLMRRNGIRFLECGIETITSNSTCKWILHSNIIEDMTQVIPSTQEVFFDVFDPEHSEAIWNQLFEALKSECSNSYARASELVYVLLNVNNSSQDTLQRPIEIVRKRVSFMLRLLDRVLFMHLKSGGEHVFFASDIVFRTIYEMRDLEIIDQRIYKIRMVDMITRGFVHAIKRNFMFNERYFIALAFDLKNAFVYNRIIIPALEEPFYLVDKDLAIDLAFEHSPRLEEFVRHFLN